MEKSKRKQMSDLLYDELVYYDYYELDEVAKVIATQLPWKMLKRIINKFRRLRNAPQIGALG